MCAAIFDADGLLLLTMRSAKKRLFPKAWVLPGGAVEINESLEASLIREVNEETGINIVQDQSDPTKYHSNG